MKRKLLAMLLCVALTLTLIGNLAVAATENVAQPTPEACTCDNQDGTHAETCALYVAPKAETKEEPKAETKEEPKDETKEEPKEEPKDETKEEPKEESDEEYPEGTLPALNTDDAKHGSAKTFTNVAPLVPAGIATPFLLRSAGNSRAVNSRAAGEETGVVLNKTATYDDDGGYKITLEAYATGSTSTEEQEVVADIVLVLDTSGSMQYPMTDDGFIKVYGNLSKVREDGVGNTHYTNNGETWPYQYAYAVQGHDATNYNSNYYTYYVVENGNYVPVWYYRNFGWITKSKYGDGLENNPNRITPSASDGDGNTQFYVIPEGNTSMYALKQSVNSFIQSMASASPSSHIAIVPFGNTVGTVTGFTSNTTELYDAVDDLTANGATNTGAGMAEANRLLSELDAAHADHKKVVVMFTDGVPASKSTFDGDVANSAISNSQTIKSGGATVYTIGIFSGADGSLSSFNDNSSTDPNTFMHLVSSNYPDATSMTNHGTVNSELNGKSYYLSASNSTALNEIFQKISYEVSGALNAELGTSTVVKDIIAPSFSVPANASDIKLYTANCTGITNGDLTFGDKTERTDLTVTIDQTNAAVNVTGFNFSQNWCGYRNNGYSGQKLIIEFTVKPKAGFLGGNNVPTNGAYSGLYMANGTLVDNFEVPTVNVPIQDIIITATDKNVYLTQVPTEAQLKDGVTIKCGNVDITDPSKLEDWQKAYVTIESNLTQSTGFNATMDGTYTVSAAVKPTTTGDSTKPGVVATEETANETKAINVFKPQLTFKDSDVWYGDTAPTDYSGNKTDEAWMHGTTQSASVAMIGTAPILSLTYNPETGTIDTANKIATKEDIPVAVTVNIGQTNVTTYTDFKHTDCTDKTCGKPTDGAFWLHVNTCTLTITKAAAQGTSIGSDEYFVFTVKKDDAPYTQVTVKGPTSVTIKELPVGNYTIEEDTSVAWRYGTPTYSGSGALSSTNSTGTLTCTNDKETNNWLNDFTRAINTFGETSPKIDGNS